MAGWTPSRASPDAHISKSKTATESRVESLFRDVGLWAGARQKKKNATVGAAFRVQLRPIANLLGLDVYTLHKWTTFTEQLFNVWFDDPDCWVDETRRRTGTMLMRELVGHIATYDEAFLIRRWRPSPMGVSTCFTTVLPERVRNPILGVSQNGEMRLSNGNRCRMGVEVDDYGAPVAYWVAKKATGDIGGNGMLEKDFDRIPIFNEFGWRQVTHIFEPQSAEQTRGIARASSAVVRAKMVDLFSELRLQAWSTLTQNAFFVRTAGGRDRAAEILGSQDPAELSVSMAEAWTASQAGYYGQEGVRINGVRVPVLHPGDEIATVGTSWKDGEVKSSVDGWMRDQAAAMGLSYESFTGDYTQTSYSSARASSGVEYRDLMCERVVLIDRAASQIFRAWFDEMWVKGVIEPIVDYWPVNGVQNSNLYAWLTNCTWIGSGRVVIDDLKQAKANALSIETLQASPFDVARENGLDLEKVLDDRQRMNAMLAERGLKLRELNTQAYVLPEDFEDANAAPR